MPTLRRCSCVQCHRAYRTKVGRYIVRKRRSANRRDTRSYLKLGKWDSIENKVSAPRLG